ncbi:hypothetical protein ACIRFH_01505 [Streptomyces sp. NPDC093586]|uniref:hypothetical protein n=1 Tax=Streptomyces sp. NPDC093586 TaxID=3366042 RepID=UPI00380648A9
MRAQRARRLLAVSAAGLTMAGGIAIGTAGTASANDSSHHDRGSYSRYCDNHNRWNDDCDWGYNGRGHDRYDNGRYDNGRFGHDNGRFGHDNGRGGHDNGRGGHDNGYGGHDNGRGGHDGGRGGHDGGRGGHGGH